MADVTSIKFGEVGFDEAVKTLRELVPMSDEEYYALNHLAQQKAISFSGAYSDSMAKAVQDVLADTVAGKIPLTDFMDRANAALDAFGTSLSAFQANTIFETSLSRAFNDGGLRRVQNSQEIQDAYPYFGIDTAMDSRVRPNHFALDWRRIKTVFPLTDMLLQAWSLPAGFRCRCARRFFSEQDVKQLGLAIGNGNDWYGKWETVTVPGGITQTVAILPDEGFGGSLTAKDRLNVALVILTLNAARLERKAA